MKFKNKLILIVILLVAAFIATFVVSPRTVSWALSSKKECKVLRVEAFSKGMIVTNASQVNKFSIICDDGYICRAEDTAFAGIKPGDNIIFRGFPELASLEEFGKCDHAQLIQFKTETSSVAAPAAAAPGMTSPVQLPGGVQTPPMVPAQIPVTTSPTVRK